MRPRDFRVRPHSVHGTPTEEQGQRSETEAHRGEVRIVGTHPNLEVKTEAVVVGLTGNKQIPDTEEGGHSSGVLGILFSPI